jgi:hypothetical protein
MKSFPLTTAISLTILLHSSTRLGRAAEPEAALVDLTQIKRSIVREPVYQSKAPKYFLLVFGAEAKTRIWLVLDGDVLYVDRNGNGDLTEDGKRVTMNKGGFAVGEIVEADSKTRHTDLSVHPAGESLSVSASIAGVTSQWVRGFRLADRPADACIVHFNGPLTPLHNGNEILRRGKKDQDLAFVLGTPGLGDRTFAAVDYEDVPSDVFPVADIEFPAKAAGGPPIRSRVVLAKRC